MASIQLLASGSYMLWKFESTLETRLLPQEFPRLSYQSMSKGSQTRRREILLGTKDEKPVTDLQPYLGAFGHLGPWKERPGYEPIIQAVAGLISLNGDPSGPEARIASNARPTSAQAPQSRLSVWLSAACAWANASR